VTDYSNPLRGIVPKVVHKNDVDDIALVELIEKLPGEVPFDAYVKALMSTPEVSERITQLENCLQRLANAVRASGLTDKSPGLRAATEEAACPQESARSGRGSESNQKTSKCAARTIPRRLAFHRTIGYEGL
jgi:hypothetical protein